MVPRNIVVLMFLGFLLRIVAGEVMGGGLNTGYEGDEGDYAKVAVRIVHGQGFTNYNGTPTTLHPPGLPLLLAMLISLTGPQNAIMRTFMSLLGSLLTPACYLLTRSLTGSQKLGWIAAAIAVVFPTWVFSSSAILTDVPAAVLVTLLAWALIEGNRRQSLSWIALAGAFWGAATLIRPACLVYAPCIALWLVLSMPCWKKSLTTVLVLMVPFACMLGPWMIRSTYVHGALVILSTQGGSELYKGNNPDATGILGIDHPHFDAALSQRYPVEQFPNEAIRSQLFQEAAVKFIRENPRRFADLCFIRFGQFWKLYSPRVPLSNNLAVLASFGLAIPFFLIQVIRAGWRRGPEMLLILIVLSQTALHMVFTSIVRYRLPIEPLVIALAIAGFRWTLSQFQYDQWNSLRWLQRWLPGT